MGNTSEPRFPLVRVDAVGEQAELLVARLFELAATGVEQRDESTLIRGPGPGQVTLEASFETDDDAREAYRVLAEERPELAWVIDELVGDAWREKYKEHFAPFLLSRRLMVVPPWIQNAEVPPGAEVLLMDPGRAFGTGLHATTALVARQLDKRSQALEDIRILDVGTGSGILALAALRLGAASAVAIDIDADAVATARQNAERNGLLARVALSTTPVEELDDCFPVVLANIRASILIEMVGALEQRVVPSGLLLLSGVLASEADRVRKSFGGAFTHEETGSWNQEQDDWVVIVLRRRD